ncbi:acetate--CoA ligase [Promethearchaeum syntrophicum]|uniref:Acetate--CoA ligase n=1 Tax=Promethearchaeum syntrophicum TaxID=2594042 RepID=A0A5B9DCT0_9ARCH|nr:acetate--CoA ligase [Candidatus Prometheoarchaeum syntrophicum]QEE16851.1 Acetyl-coenzyme A synthetase [Candidatus Prometheoarchaeum syntrophicum]
MSESDKEKQKIYYPNPELATNARIKSMDTYKEMWKKSVDNPREFWAEEAKMVTFSEPYKEVWTGSTPEDFVGKWFQGGKLNVCYNCVDRWVEKGYGNEKSLVWIGEDDTVKNYTFKALQDEVSKTANALKELGVKKGDRVCLWLPMISELAVTMLACARIGAIHSIVFGGFSASSVKDRIDDSDCTVLVVADEVRRSGKARPMKKNLEGIIETCPSIEHVAVVKVTGGDVWKYEKDVDFTALVEKQSIECPCEPMDSEDVLFILYTSGTTGKPKGVVHTTAGFLVYGMSTNKYVWDYSCLIDLKGVEPKDRDVWYCTADIGWITGHTQIIYSPLALGAITVMYEGVPTWPHKGRFWEICEKYGVTHFYTAPTAIRALMRFGDAEVNKWNLEKLKMLGTVGEVCNWPEWKWYWDVVGKGSGGEKPVGRPIVDSYWQTETGSYMMVNLGAITPMKPGSCTFPYFGINPVLLNEEGEKNTEPMTQSYFAYDMPWPGLMRTVWGDHDRFVQTYLTKFPGHYFTGDYAQIDAEGYYFILGRSDDVIKVSGHRLGSAEVEAAINSHPKVAESAVCPYPHSMKGSTIFAYITLMQGVEKAEELKAEIVAHVRSVAGPTVKPEIIMFSDALPKTRSGKIMRRVLKAIATMADIGDVMTLSNPEVVQHLIDERAKLGEIKF